MIKTILTDILRTFSPDELKKFSEMIHSPYFNKQNSVIKLFEYIKNYYPDFNDFDLKKENIYKKIFPGRKFNYGTMKNLIYDLQRLTEKFVAFREIEINEFEFKKAFVNGYRERKLNTLSEKNLKELEKHLRGKELIDDDFFLKMHQLNRIRQSGLYESSKGNINITSKISSPYYEQYLKSSSFLKKYYHLSTLRAFNNILTNKNIFDTEEVVKDCKEFLKLIKEEDLKDVSLNLEFNFLKMNLGIISEDEFLKFKKLVLTDLYNMNADKSIIYAYSIYLLNYCRVKNKSDEKYKFYAFEILKSMADNNNFDVGTGYMDIVLMRNIIIISTGLKEFSWCEKFLEAYMKQVHPEYRDSIMIFYGAHKSFYEHRYENSLEFLSILKFDDIYNKNYIKELMVMNYYELKYFDLLREQLDAYKKFLVNNDSIPDSYRLLSEKFIQYVYKLFKLNSANKKDMLYLKKKISEEYELLYKDWFLMKIEELEFLKL